MREKFLAKCDEHECGMIVFGIAYDHKKKRLFVGGPLRFYMNIQDVVEKYFGVSFNPIYDVRRVRSRSRCDAEAWEKGVGLLCKDFRLLPVRSFGRLMR